MATKPSKKPSTVKKAPKKTMRAASSVVKKTAGVQKSASKSEGLSMSVLGVDGKAKGTITLPASLFSAVVNMQLIAQAVRVFLANQREGSANTKTRGEVAGSTRKIYRQKGTGRARHGGIRAPIFVGGGIVFGPRTRTIRRTLPQKMRHAALASALTHEKNAGHIIVVDGISALEPKTKAIVKTLEAVGASYPLLLVVPKDAQGVRRSAANVSGVDISQAHELNSYDVLSHRTIVFMKEALSALA
jgi:large subunit ribosomal protein L4